MEINESLRNSRIIQRQNIQEKLSIQECTMEINGVLKDVMRIDSIEIAEDDGVYQDGEEPSTDDKIVAQEDNSLKLFIKRVCSQF